MFGEVFRAARMAAKSSQVAVAAEMGLSHAYVQDVEVGRRDPFKIAVIERAALFLGAELAPLLDAEACDRKCVIVPVSADDDPARRDVAVRLSRGWLALDDETVRKIGALL